MLTRRARCGPVNSCWPIGRRPLAELFGELAPAVMPGRRAGRLRLVAVRIPGVPSIHVEEALWTCQESLAAGLAE